MWILVQRQAFLAYWSKINKIWLIKSTLRFTKPKSFSRNSQGPTNSVASCSAQPRKTEILMTSFKPYLVNILLPRRNYQKRSCKDCNKDTKVSTTPALKKHLKYRLAQFQAKRQKVKKQMLLIYISYSTCLTWVLPCLCEETPADGDCVRFLFITFNEHMKS